MIQEVFEKISKKTNNDYIQNLNNVHSFKQKQFLTKSGQTILMPSYIDVDFELNNNDTRNLLELKIIRELILQLNDKENKEKLSTLKRRISHLTVNKKDKILAIQELHTLQRKMKDPPFLYVLSKDPEINVQKSSSRNEKIKQKVIENIMMEYPFNLFKFNKRSECESRETSKPYYISKKDMLQVIQSNPDLTAKFPKGYKTLKKEDLCGVIFK